MAEDYVVVAKPGEEDAQGEEEEEELLPHRRPEAAAILDKLGAAHDYLLENGAWPRGDAAVDAASLFDLCRGMLQCPDVPRMHGVLIALLASDKIVIDRFKDRVNSPSAGGWVD